MNNSGLHVYSCLGLLPVIYIYIYTPHSICYTVLLLLKVWYLIKRTFTVKFTVVLVFCTPSGIHTGCLEMFCPLSCLSHCPVSLGLCWSVSYNMKSS